MFKQTYISPDFDKVEVEALYAQCVTGSELPDYDKEDWE